MLRKSRKNKAIIQFILDKISIHPKDIVSFTAHHFGITRMTANRYLQQLIADNLLVAKGGSTSARSYELKNILDKTFHFSIDAKTAEHTIWKKTLEPYFKEFKKNVVDICYYGVTEMINNVIDHSQSKTVSIRLKRNAKRISVQIKDNGIGIFNKIRCNYHLDDLRHALLELSKGKLTTDPKHHSGQGIFFTSKIFDYFSIKSDGLLYACFLKTNDWLVEIKDTVKTKGTIVLLEINCNTTRTTKEIFDKFTDDDYVFSRTRVPVRLAKQGREELISRSQAKQILSGCEKFSEIVLDFQDVSHIGQAFTDQIFRVFKNEYPKIKITTLNTNQDIKKSIKVASNE